MRFHSGFWIPPVLLTLVSAAALTQTTPPPQTADANTITVTVTAIGHGDAAPPSITSSDVVVHQGNNDRPVLSLKPVDSGDPKLDLAVVIDDSIATRWNELRNFLTALTAGARVAVAYANRGAIQMARQPVADHILAENALRDPAGVDILNTSPYESLQTLINGWPSRQGRRAIIFVSSGIDFPSGGASAEAQGWPALEKAVEGAQRKAL